MRTFLIIVVLGLVCVCCYVLFQAIVGDRSAYRKQGESTVGRRENEVTRMLGKPKLVLKPESSDYPVSGYGKPRERKFDHVWVYFQLDDALYVYFDRRGTVISTEVTGG